MSAAEEKVTLLGAHEETLQVDEQHVAVLERLGWVRARPREPKPPRGREQEEPPPRKPRRGS